MLGPVTMAAVTLLLSSSTSLGTAPELPAHASAQMLEFHPIDGGTVGTSASTPAPHVLDRWCNFLPNACGDFMEQGISHTQPISTSTLIPTLATLVQKPFLCVPPSLPVPHDLPPCLPPTPAPNSTSAYPSLTVHFRPPFPTPSAKDHRSQRVCLITYFATHPHPSS